MHEASKVLELALKGKDVKLRYWNGRVDFEKLGVLTASDASFTGKSNNRSQQGRIHFLALAAQLCDLSCDTYDVMVVSFSSTAIKRVCRAGRNVRYRTVRKLEIEIELCQPKSTDSDTPRQPHRL